MKPQLLFSPDAPVCFSRNSVGKTAARFSWNCFFFIAIPDGKLLRTFPGIAFKGARRLRGGLPFNHRSRMGVGMTDVPDGPSRRRDYEHAEDDMRDHYIPVCREVQHPGRDDQPEPED